MIISLTIEVVINGLISSILHETNACASTALISVELFLIFKKLRGFDLTFGTRPAFSQWRLLLLMRKESKAMFFIEESTRDGALPSATLDLAIGSGPERSQLQISGNDET